MKGPWAGNLELHNGLPVILPSSGSIGNNGALSGLTALPTTYARCFMYFPANAIAAGVAAGLYYVEMSGTQAGTIYNNTYTSGLPKEPVSKVAFATVGPGAYAQTTAADIALITLAMAAGALGRNGRLIGNPSWSIPGNTNNKTMKMKMGGSAPFQITIAGATQLSFTPMWIVRARDSEAAQVAVGTNGNIAGLGPSTATSTFTAVNLAAAWNLVFSGQLAVATDFIVLEGFSVDVRKA